MHFAVIWNLEWILYINKVLTHCNYRTLRCLQNTIIILGKTTKALYVVETMQLETILSVLSQFFFKLRTPTIGILRFSFAHFALKWDYQGVKTWSWVLGEEPPWVPTSIYPSLLHIVVNTPNCLLWDKLRFSYNSQ